MSPTGSFSSFCLYRCPQLGHQIDHEVGGIERPLEVKRHSSQLLIVTRLGLLPYLWHMVLDFIPFSWFSPAVSVSLTCHNSVGNLTEFLFLTCLLSTVFPTSTLFTHVYLPTPGLTLTLSKAMGHWTTVSLSEIILLFIYFWCGPGFTPGSVLRRSPDGAQGAIFSARDWTIKQMHAVW